MRQMTGKWKNSGHLSRCRQEAFVGKKWGLERRVSGLTGLTVFLSPYALHALLLHTHLVGVHVVLAWRVGRQCVTLQGGQVLVGVQADDGDEEKGEQLQRG